MLCLSQLVGLLGFQEYHSSSVAVACVLGEAAGLGLASPLLENVFCCASPKPGKSLCAGFSEAACDDFSGKFCSSFSG